MSFHMKFRKKSGIAQIRNNPENQEVLDGLSTKGDLWKTKLYLEINDI